MAATQAVEALELSRLDSADLFGNGQVSFLAELNELFPDEQPSRSPNSSAAQAHAVGHPSASSASGEQQQPSPSGVITSVDAEEAFMQALAQASFANVGGQASTSQPALGAGALYAGGAAGANGAMPLVASGGRFASGHLSGSFSTGTNGSGDSFNDGLIAWAGLGPQAHSSSFSSLPQSMPLGAGSMQAPPAWLGLPQSAAQTMPMFAPQLMGSMMAPMGQAPMASQPSLDMYQAVLQARAMGGSDAAAIATGSGAVWGSHFAATNFSAGFQQDGSSMMAVGSFMPGAAAAGGGTNEAALAGGPASTSAPAAAAPFATKGRGRTKAVAAVALPAEGEEQPISRFKKSRLKAKANMQALERELEEKLAAVKLLSATNQDLRTKSEVLEKAIQVRDKQISLYKKMGPPNVHGELLSPQDQAVKQEAEAMGLCPVDRAAMIAITPLEAGKRACDAEAMAAGAPAVKQEAADTPALPPMDPAMLQEAQRFQRISQSHVQEGASPATMLQNFTEKLDAAPMMVRKMKFMPLSEVATHWKFYVHQASQRLMELEARPDDPELKAGIVALVGKIGFGCMNVAALNPDVMLRFTTYNIEQGRIEETWSSDLDAHWAKVLDMLHLSDSQQRQLVEVFELAARDLLKVSDAQKRLQQEWAALMHGTKEGHPLPNELVERHQEFVKLFAATFKRDYSAHFLLNATFFDQILDAFQMARIIVHSWPYFPNVCSMALVLCHRRGRTPPAQLPHGRSTLAMTMPGVATSGAATEQLLQENPSWTPAVGRPGARA